MTTPSTVWGEIRSTLATPDATALAHVVQKIHQCAPPEDELNAMIEHLARGLQPWPAATRKAARLPYVPWLHQLCDRALDAEARGDEHQLAHDIDWIEAFKPDALPTLAIHTRRRIHQHVSQKGWEDLPFEHQQTRDAFSLLGRYAQENPDALRSVLREPPMYRDGYPYVLKHLFEKVCIYGPEDSGEYFWATVSRDDALLGLCALQVMLMHTPSSSLSRAMIDYCWEICLGTIYPTSYTFGYAKTLSRPMVFVDLDRMRSRPFIGGFAAPLFQQDGLVQVVLSGMQLYQRHAIWSARELSESWAGLERLTTFSALDDDLLWASGPGKHWDEDRLRDTGQRVVERLDKQPGAKFNDNEYRDELVTHDDWDDWDDDEDWEE